MFPIKCFTPKPFIDAAEVLLASDETLKALDLLSTLPEYYIDHPVPEIEALKKEIMAKIATSTFYAQHVGCETEFSDEQVLTYQMTLRNQLIAHDVKVLNEAGFKPHVWDHGPGESAVPLILGSKGYDFTYEQVYLNEPTRIATKHRYEKYQTLLPIVDRPVIWISTEIIEHLHCEQEIRFEMERRCVPDVIHISTPLYTFNPNVENWRDIGFLGHLRTYSPKSFKDVLQKMFPEYVMGYYQSQIQHARLINPQSKFEVLKTHYEIKED